MRVARFFRSRWGLALALVADLLLAAGPNHPYPVSGASLSAAMAAQAQVTEDWLALDGVVGTAVGVRGRREAVLKVYLTAPGVVTLPRAVAGVPVVMEVTGPLVARGEAGGGVANVDPTAGFPRPVPIGVSTGHPDVSAGTIGARVTDGSRVFALSNNHVYAAVNGGREGDHLLQPGVVDGGRDPEDALGTLFAYEPLRFCTGGACPVNEMDAALALTTPDDLGRETPEDGYGAPRSGPVKAELGMSVQKYGRTTGHTRGRVTGIHATIDVSYRTGTARFEDQIMISDGSFSAGGDSGSLVVTHGVLLGDRRPVGLLFAGSNTHTIANPIGKVLDRFGVRVDGG